MSKIKNIGFAIWLSLAVNWYAEDGKNTSSVCLDAKNILTDTSISTHNLLINTQEVCEKIFQEINTNYAWILSKDEQRIVHAILNDPDFQKNLSKDLQESKNEWSTQNIIKGLIFMLIYGLAYAPTLWYLEKGEKSISALSFTWFAVASAWSAAMNWVVPGSLVYAETFILASIAVMLELKNRKNSHNISKNHTSDQELLHILTHSPDPIVIYDYQDAPIYWNKKIEEVSGYTFGEIQEYYKQHGEVMSLLYKWEEYTKVMKYLTTVKETGIWYDRVAFTLTTEWWEKITILWSNDIVHGKSLRRGRILENPEEILFEKNNTSRYIHTDFKTWAFKIEALENDLKEWNYLQQPKVVAYFDVDSFKSINDGYWHTTGDMILQEIVQCILKKIRPEDKIYRKWWDEFCIIYNSDFEWYNQIIKNLNEIRTTIANKEFLNDENEKIKVSLSMGVKIIDPKTNPFTLISITDVDKIMYFAKKLWDFSSLIPSSSTKKIVGKNKLCCMIYDENWRETHMQILWDSEDFTVPHEALEKSKEIRKNNF